MKININHKTKFQSFQEALGREFLVNRINQVRSRLLADSVHGIARTWAERQGARKHSIVKNEGLKVSKSKVREAFIHYLKTNLFKMKECNSHYLVPA